MSTLARSRPYLELTHGEHSCNRCGIHYRTDYRASDTAAKWCRDCRPIARQLGWAVPHKLTGITATQAARAVA